MTRISSFTGGFSGYSAVSKSFSGGGGDAEYDGAVMLFAQSAAPTGWTKVTTYNDYGLRVVSGNVSSGGSLNFSTVFASQPLTGTLAATASAGSYSLSTPQLPAHSHSSPRVVGQIFMGGGVTYSVGSYSPLGVTNNPSGAGGAHNHSGAPVNLSYSGSLDLSIKYVDAILASF